MLWHKTLQQIKSWVSKHLFQDYTTVHPVNDILVVLIYRFYFSFDPKITFIDNFFLTLCLKIHNLSSKCKEKEIDKCTLLKATVLIISAPQFLPQCLTKDFSTVPFKLKK